MIGNWSLIASDCTDFPCNPVLAQQTICPHENCFSSLTNLILSDCLLFRRPDTMDLHKFDFFIGTEPELFSVSANSLTIFSILLRVEATDTVSFMWSSFLLWLSSLFPSTSLHFVVTSSEITSTWFFLCWSQHFVLNISFASSTKPFTSSCFLRRISIQLFLSRARHFSFVFELPCGMKWKTIQFKQ